MRPVLHNGRAAALALAVLLLAPGCARLRALTATAPIPARTRAAQPLAPPAVAPLLRVQAEPALAETLLPRLAGAFLIAHGSPAVTLVRGASVVEVHNRNPEHPAWIGIRTAPADAAFAALADGSADIVATSRAPTAAERTRLGALQRQALAFTTGAALYARQPPAKPASAFLSYTDSAAGYVIGANAADSPGGKAAASSTDPAAGGTTADGRRIVTLPEGMSVKFGPIKDVRFPNRRQVLILPRLDQARPARGTMEVECTIQRNGVPADCSTVSALGAGTVAVAILDWLHSGAIRYAPGNRNGRLVQERRRLTVDFRQPTATE